MAIPFTSVWSECVMRIYASSPGERKIDLRFPTGLMFNRLTAAIAAPIMSRKLKARISVSALICIMQEIRRCRKQMPNWNLVEVSSPNSGDVIIIL